MLYFQFMVFSFGFAILALIITEEELNWLYEINKFIPIFLISLLGTSIFLIAYHNYNILKYRTIYKKNALEVLLTLFLITILGIALRILLSGFLHTHLKIKFFINIIVFMLIFILFFTFFLFFTSLLNQKRDPIKTNFKKAQDSLNKLLKESNRIENNHLTENETIIYKNLADIFEITDYYNDGIMEITKSFGEVIPFDEIINSKTRKSLNEILDQLTFSAPYYIFYGRLEQIRQMDNHLKNINKYIGEIYSIAGYDFLNEMLEMNNIIEKYLKENSFELPRKKASRIKKNEFYKRNLFLFVLSIFSTAIIYLLK